jgi:putative addiction module component (TIGR02574 family)
MTKDQVLSEAMALDPAERDEVAEALWQSLRPTEFTAEQRAEIRRRIEALDSGKAHWLPGRQVMRELREHLRK